ncbi:MAG: ABC transporter permease subunit [Pseudomonadales bacterium]
MSKPTTQALIEGNSFFQTKRRFKDRFARYAIATGGMAVIGAILLIFLYLLYEIVPLFQSADMQQETAYSITAADKPAYIAIEEQGTLFFRLSKTGLAEFREVDGGAVRSQQALVELGIELTSFAVSSEESRTFGLGMSNGSVLLAKHDYDSIYDGDDRTIVPRITFPIGDQPRIMTDSTRSIVALAVRDAEELSTIAALGDDGQLHIMQIEKEQDFLSEEWVYSENMFNIDDVGSQVRRLLMTEDQRYVFVLSQSDDLKIYDLQAARSGRIDALVAQHSLATGETVSDLRFLLGGISLLVKDSSGTVSQWFWQAFDGQRRLEKVRTFEAPVGAATLLTEQRRKGFVILNEGGMLQLAHSTANSISFEQQLTLSGSLVAAAIAPRANLLLVEDQSGTLQVWTIDNPHPEISFAALWDEVWYESYSKPEYVWQSSASSNDFEPKYSFAPLAFGTLKAAFYSMLLAAPLAICAAVYTAFFMAPGLRRKVKPLIELMEALPTVILGFLAGLWLAPFFEKHLPAVFGILLLMPPAILLIAFVWSRLPAKVRNIVPEGWHAVLLIPIVLGLSLLCIASSQPVELLLFSGDARAWLTNEIGISFDQRNALVVGVAMGFAVIPTIFSIAEDAIFSVPKHLANGSLALGATPWQTLLRVILPTASPGIFSALMIGLGRAVGETMIVLMATGNTPIMDVNIFEGMRTLAANIAVEVPEAEVDSTHYRVLFLAAFVLFMFTFTVNTMAELVRQRLRERYGSL